MKKNNNNIVEDKYKTVPIGNMIEKENTTKSIRMSDVARKFRNRLRPIKSKKDNAPFKKEIIVDVREMEIYAHYEQKRKEEVTKIYKDENER